MIQPIIRCFESLKKELKHDSCPLCVFSGGLDGTYLLNWLSESGCKEFFTLSVDLGGDFDAKLIRELSNRFGATGIIITDRIDEFSKDFVQLSVPAQATYLGGHPISASLSRPMIAKIALEVAQQNNCDMIIHTSNRSQNSLRRFNGALSSLEYKGIFGSPYDLGSISREEKIIKLESNGVIKKENMLYSTDSNFWCREFESGNGDDPEAINVPESLYLWTKKSKFTQDIELKINFYKGIPISLDDVSMGFVSLVNILNHKVGKFGLGRYVGLEEIESGCKVQEFREMPAAFVLFDAYRRLESACIGSECIREKIHIEQLWVREAIEGRWYNSLRYAANAFIQTVSQKVTGSVSYQLSMNNLKAISIKADKPLYIRSRREYEKLPSNFEANGK